MEMLATLFMFGNVLSYGKGTNLFMFTKKEEKSLEVARKKFDKKIKRLLEANMRTARITAKDLAVTISVIR